MLSLQRQYYYCNILLVVLSLVIAGCAKRPPRPSGPSHPPEGQVVAPRPSGLPVLRAPVIRIGLKTESRSVSVSAAEPLFFRSGKHNGTSPSRLTASLSFVPELSIRYSVQIGSFSSRENAEKALRELQEKGGFSAFVFDNRDQHLFQVRVGPYSSQEQAQRAAEELKSKGYPNSFYVPEEAAAGALPELVVRDEMGEILLKTKMAIQIWTAREPLEIDSAKYRGYVSIFVNRAGRLTVVNHLNFEDYLKGVVPNEIGPATAANFEALKAQAVAARTYAFKNLKQFDTEGYDLCATPRCQVYSGYGTEHGMTSRAVEETAGEIVTFGGEPINALYTSTCGGKTENAEIMFEGWNYPYLRSVECYPEEKESTRTASLIRGQAQPWWQAWLSVKLGRSYSGDFLSPVTAREAQSEINALLEFLGKKSCSDTEVQRTDWISIADSLVQQLCWQKKMESLLDLKDYQYMRNRLGLPDSPGVRPFLLMFHEEIMEPASGNDPDRPMTRQDLFTTMFRLMDHYRQINGKDGQAREVSGNSMQVVDDQGVHSLRLNTPLYLYQKIGESVTPKQQLSCGTGDTIEYYGDADSVAILACEVSSAGASLDRESKYSFWRETYTPEQLREKISRYIDAGEIVDLQPLSYGQSGRIYELKVTGKKGSGILRGIRVRWGLGLRDNWFTLDRIEDRNGKIKEFVFTGRGWGHGVGMCQVGALGFAKMGKDYHYILQHYYSQVEIRKAY